MFQAIRIHSARILIILAALSLLVILPGVAGAQEDTFVYWGGLIFSEEANNAFVERIEAWGEERGVPVEVVMINQNETVQRVSAAIEAGTMPDALDLGWDFMLLLSQSDQLVALNDVYDEIGEAHGGWLESINTLMTNEAFGGEIYGIPYAASGINILHRRNDALESAGFPDAPETWEEIAEMSAAAQNPPEHYGMGFALSNVGDANLTTTMLQSWGGRVADDTGTTCTLDSPETRAFLEWITGAFEDGLFPPGVTTWDGAGDNTAYQSGNALFIANPGSVYLNIRDNDPELLEFTRYSGLPAGPVMRLVPMSTVIRSIPASTSPEKQERAKDLFAYLAEDEFMAEYMSAAIYGPAMQSQVDFPVFTESPVHVGLLDAALSGTPGTFPDVNNTALAEYQTNFLTPKMIQRIVVDGLSIDESIAETQAACQAIYDRNNAG
jgi:multiple sugar transport system substrate-binding protein